MGVTVSRKVELYWIYAFETEERRFHLKGVQTSCWSLELHLRKDNIDAKSGWDEGR
jgi:hypothetical protein